MSLMTRLALVVPLIQAPMAGVATPLLASAVSEAGALGSIGLGGTDADGARAMIVELRSRTQRAFNVNLFVHRAPKADPAREAAWLAQLAPVFAEVGMEPPAGLKPSFSSFLDDPDMLAMLLETAPPVVSFHFGLPPAAVISAFRSRGTYLIATVTNPAEAEACQAAGIDAIVAQGIEAGGHRGMFDPSAPDDGLGMATLTRLLVRHSNIPVIAAGGIMDGAGIAAALDLGASAAQLGTAFIACPESAADDAYRAALLGPAAFHTSLTSVVSGRPARILAGCYTAVADQLTGSPPPDFPIAYAASRALHAAARKRGEHGFAARWAGQGAPLIRPMPAADLVRLLETELEQLR